MHAKDRPAVQHYCNLSFLLHIIFVVVVVVIIIISIIIVMIIVSS